ncbi:MAG: AmmeMemoRadiSam system radical SAM enzyme, partial [Candidatus Bathyarchaeia archaeon]
KFDKPPTPVKVLEKACEMARRMGAYYVYIGNVPGHKYENTYCPSCGEVLIKRYGLSVIQIRLREDLKCPNCGREIPIVGKAVVRKGIFW